ncbi:MAG: hypothetical protein ACD_2C00016G0010 [uncultured bacterium (gcode 4)]|uniref:Uncharacterized protein n=1 Tax=uncultured bacterium (gcode 4) TaxID=1234023 RepID=K2GII8_9BACT|nr:MAG: hypothetical protein ACD_2C00016G0010 [uncultured bacterium (gcode 4)]
MKQNLGNFHDVEIKKWERFISLIFFIVKQCSIMVDAKFIINESWLEYFKEKLLIWADSRIIMKDAREFKKELEKVWKKGYSLVNRIFESFFETDIWITISVEVYPQYFNLWAINIDRWLIIIWQPAREPDYYLGVLGHEMAHYLIAHKKIGRLTEEIICFMLEKKIIEAICNEEHVFDYKENIDDFHLRAIRYAESLYAEFNDFYEKKDLIWLSEFIDNTTDDEDKSIVIPKNITSYLKTLNA